MYKGIKISITIFVVFSGLLNAMEKEEDSGSKSENLLNEPPLSLEHIVEDPSTIKLLERDRCFPDNSCHPTNNPFEEEEKEPEERLPENEKKVSTAKSADKKDTQSLGVYIATRPLIWSIKAANQLALYLDKRPIAQTLFVYSVQIAGEMVSMNPQMATSLVKVGVGRGGKLASFLITREGSAAILASIVGGKSLFPLITTFISSGNFFATWRVGGQVDTVDQKVEKVIEQMNGLSAEMNQLSAGMNQLSEDGLNRHREIIQQLGDGKEEIKRLKKELMQNGKMAKQLKEELLGKLTTIETSIGFDVDAIQRMLQEQGKKIDSLALGQQELKGGQEKIVQRQEKNSDLLQMMKRDLASLNLKIDNMNPELIVALWQKEQKPVQEETRKQYERLQEHVEKLGEKLESISKMEWENASITALNSLKSTVDDRLGVVEREIENIKQENIALTKQVEELREQAKETQQLILKLQEQMQTGFEGLRRDINRTAGEAGEQIAEQVTNLLLQQMIRQKMLSTPHIPNAIMASTNYSGEEEKKEED